MTSIAERIFDGGFAESELEASINEVPYEKLGCDDYDCSLELYGVPVDYRLTEPVQRIIKEAGFVKVYVNHVDKWETHYTWGHPDKPFSPVEGWRVSYPHKRGPEEKGIWVEKVIPTWPDKWFDTGYVLVKKPE